MIDINKKYIVEGSEVRILCTDRKNSGNKTVVVMYENGNVAFYTAEGKFWLSGDSAFDLVEVWKPQHEEWCYFWNSKNIPPLVLQFDKLSPVSWGSNYVDFNSIQPTIRFAEEAGEYYTSTNWNFCAPFNGKFPEEFQGV